MKQNIQALWTRLRSSSLLTRATLRHLIPVAIVAAGLALVACFIAYGKLDFLGLLLYFLGLFVVVLLARVFLWFAGKAQGVLFTVLNILSIAGILSLTLGLIVYAVIDSSFRFDNMSWRMVFATFWRSGTYYTAVLVLLILFGVMYGAVMTKGNLLALFRGGLRGKGKLGQIEANMENSRWMTDKERDGLFTPCRYSELSEMQKDGVPIRALAEGERDMRVVFNSPCHSLIIGSTGSGKTTTFINPMIQLLGASGAGSSMLITDPKGELFSLHSQFLAERGYDVKVLDLRDAYHSYRWNPLEPLWDLYRVYAEAPRQVYARTVLPASTGLKLTGSPEEYGATWFEFNGKGYPNLDRVAVDLKIFRSQTFDEMYEDMNDLVSVLIPVQNQNDPMWEKGARAVTMGVLLAMLEDSEIPELGMTKERFNLFNMAKILQQSDNEYQGLRDYFAGRSPLSKAVASARQVIDAPEKTRSSYMSVLLEKLSIFNDTGICALTSASDFQTSDLAERPTALFLKIPDEKDTRHGLAAIFMTNVYKSLIKVASQYEDLSLPRNVYYILDEFGNMPKIEKFDKMITVGRSRKIWFNMVVQSYSQLNNVYGDTVADIVKGNCGIKMFIGSNDMGTCKEFSELCGNITIVTQGSSSSGKNDSSYSQSLQTRPLIYPSELQKLNNKTSTGNSIVVTFGNHPLKTNFTPSYKVPVYRMGTMSTDDLEGRLFDEEEVYYDIHKRNAWIFGDGAGQEALPSEAEPAPIPLPVPEPIPLPAPETVAEDVSEGLLEETPEETVEEALAETLKETVETTVSGLTEEPSDEPAEDSDEFDAQTSANESHP